MRRLYPLLVSLSCLFAGSIALAQTADDRYQTFIEEAKQRCFPPTKLEPLVYTEDFSWNQSTQQVQKKFEKIYGSGKRLEYRAFYEPQKQQFMLQLDRFNGTKVFPVTEQMFKSVMKHIETALQQGYAEQIFFPDMGHSHFYVKSEIWKSQFDSIDAIQEMEKMYQRLFDSPHTRVLYHTAEQLHMKEDDGSFATDHLKFRYWNRNVVGNNNGDASLQIYVENNSKYNTINSIDGYFTWSAGFNISASEQGCFPYLDVQGNKLYFDLSLHDLPTANQNIGPFLAEDEF